MPTTDKPNNDDGLTLLDQKRALEDEIWFLAIAENYARGRLKGVLSREEVIAKYYTQYPEMKAYVDDHVARKTCLYGIRELRTRRETNQQALQAQRSTAPPKPARNPEMEWMAPFRAEPLTIFLLLGAHCRHLRGEFRRGLTHFQAGRKPRVRISASLAGDENRQNRLRTTLAHEYGHVRFHAYLWDLEPPGPDLLKSNPNASMQICYRDNILDAAQTDWMEWQAGYVCGALLMPASKVRELAGAYLESHGLFGVAGQRDSHGLALIESARTGFEVSADAARIRLLKLGILGTASAGPSLFDIVPPAS